MSITKLTHAVIISFFTLCSGFTYQIAPKPTRSTANNGIYFSNCNGYKKDKRFPLLTPLSRESATSLSSSAALIAKSGLDLEAGLYMLLLALQFGTQPALTKKFTPKGINRSTVVMAQVSGD